MLYLSWFSALPRSFCAHFLTFSLSTSVLVVGLILSGSCGIGLYFAKDTLATLILSSLYVTISSICSTALVSATVVLFPTSLRYHHYLIFLFFFKVQILLTNGTMHKRRSRYLRDSEFGLNWSSSQVWSVRQGENQKASEVFYEWPPALINISSYFIILQNNDCLAFDDVWSCWSSYWQFAVSAADGVWLPATVCACWRNYNRWVS